VLSVSFHSYPHGFHNRDTQMKSPAHNALPTSNYLASCCMHPASAAQYMLLQVVDVGGGTGFCTQGIVKHVDPSNVTLLDQSDHQMAKAAKKPDLKGIQLVKGDAEDLPFEDDTFDRYVSAGSIEYWPEPQRGIAVCETGLVLHCLEAAPQASDLEAASRNLQVHLQVLPSMFGTQPALQPWVAMQEAYRVIQPGGVACLIGPVHPTFPLSRFFADAWMLFPTEDEYKTWFEAAGFEDVQIKRIAPTWYRGVRRHGLIMGCSVTGVKPQVCHLYTEPLLLRKPNPRAVEKGQSAKTLHASFVARCAPRMHTSESMASVSSSLFVQPGASPLELGPKAETSHESMANPLLFLLRLLLGTTAGFYFFLVPVYMWFKNKIWPKNAAGF
jgi:ubiquinone/menaquinone biosynthesis C-methylase UbiE